jgi:hypothetical protein
MLYRLAFPARNPLLCAGLNQSSLLLYNNVLALPLMAAFLLLATNEAAEVATYPQVRPHLRLWCASRSGPGCTASCAWVAMQAFNCASSGSAVCCCASRAPIA